MNEGSKGLCVTVTPSGNINIQTPNTYGFVPQVSPKSLVTCMVYFTDRSYKKFSRVRVLIQPLEEVKRNEKSLCLVARTTSASAHQSSSLIPRGWLPEWLEKRPEVSEKTKKLYAYLTYFAGGKGYATSSAERTCCNRTII
jgi:hypothetical protein